MKIKVIGDFRGHEFHIVKGKDGYYTLSCDDKEIQMKWSDELIPDVAPAGISMEESIYAMIKAAVTTHLGAPSYRFGCSTFGGSECS